MPVDWSRLRQLVDGHQRFLVTTHVRPDGDALGSELAMAAMLEQLGKRAWIVNASHTPPRYKFLDRDGRILHLRQSGAAAAMGQAEVVLILDTSAWAQLGDLRDFIAGTAAAKVVIDHHVGGDDLGAESFVDTSAAACGELLAEAAEALGCRLTPDIAEPLLVALGTDTGWFRFSCTDGTALRTAARLVDSGARISELYRAVFEDNTPERLKLISRTLDSLRVVADGRVAYSAIRLDDLKATGAVPQDSEDLVNYTMSLRGVDMGLMFIELPSGEVKVSFRCREGFDCNRIAAQFGGGGHMQAAGATMQAPLEQVRARVLDAVKKALQDQQPSNR